jgi:hypothetical protein
MMGFLGSMSPVSLTVIVSRSNYQNAHLKWTDSAAYPSVGLFNKALTIQ